MAWSAASLAWQVGSAAWSYWTAIREPRVRRWRTVIRGHRLDAFDALVRLGVEDAPATVTYDYKALASKLTPQVLNATAHTFNVRPAWLLGVDDRPYDLMYLERSFPPLLRELRTWQAAGSGHTLLVFKSSADELDANPFQHGALVLMREMGESDAHPTYAYWPVASLDSWAEPQQHWLAMRMIWTTWHLKFPIRGYNVSAKQCALLRHGKLFAGDLQQEWGAGSWHPDDYVVRPSQRAKGNDALVETLHKDHEAELCRMANVEIRRLCRAG